MTASRFVSYIRLATIAILVICGGVQLIIDPSFINFTCSVIDVVVSGVTIVYLFDVRRFRRAPMSCLMLLGFNVSAFSAALLIQTLDGRSLVYNLTAPLETFLALAATHAVVLVTHWVYLRSKVLLGLRFWLNRSVFTPLGLLRAPSDTQLWVFGLTGCLATVISARNYTTGSADYGNVSEKFFLGYIAFAVAPFLVPLRTSLLGGAGGARTKWAGLIVYALLLIAVAMANNARATFSSGFLTLALCIVIAVLSGNLVITRTIVAKGLLIAALGIPLFTTLSDLATAMVIARDERSNVSSMELIEITMGNFMDKALIEDRRRRDAAILGGDYNENYVANPILARFVYTKFTDVNMTNALSLSDGQAEQIRRSTWSRVLAMLPTPILNALHVGVDKADIGFSSGDVYSFVARGLELGSYTTGSEIPDGMTIFGQLFWPVLGLIVLVEFIVYDALSAFDPAGQLRLSAVVLLNVVPIFTLGVMQESVSNQVTGIVRGIPQLILLYLILSVASNVIERLLPLAGAGRGAQRLA